MTVFQLQEDIAAEVKDTLSGMLFKTPDGKEKCIHTFRHDLPKREQDIQIGNLLGTEEDEEENPYPFCVVKTESGEIVDGAQRVQVSLVFGIFNDDNQNRGKEELINIIHRVSERFITRPVLKEKYRLVKKNGIQWILDDEDRYPYFIGAMSMDWDTLFAESEDKYA